MAEGLEVVIKYRGAKYHQVASPATPSSEFAILKKDLAHLRVHSPSQKNVRRVNGSFILHWPAAGTSTKVVGLADSLHQRWFKLCSNDPEALKLRNFLSIESITLTQDGALIRSTADAREASQDASPGTLAGRWGNPLLGTLQQPTPTPSLPSRPPPIPPPRVPPSAPRLDRQQPPHLKRRISGAEAPPSPTRPKLDAPEVPATSINTRPKQTPLPTSPRADRQRESATPIDATSASPQPMQEDATPLARAHPPTAAKPPEPQVLPSPREPGEMTPQTIPTPIPGPPSTGSGGASSTSRLPPPNHPPLSIPPRPPPSPYPSSSSSGNGDLHAPRRRDRDENRLTRELWDTRRQLTAIQAREQVILDDLERIGVRPENTGVDRSDVLREELARLEDELRAERARRMRAERVLNDVERECRTPFVVPALFQAFMSISELSN